MYFATLDVFTSTPFLGNPLALVVVEDKERAALDGGDTTTTTTLSTKQRIAKEFNLSETVFLYLAPGETLAAPAPGAGAQKRSREMRVFTIDKELPFAGHPTIGTAYFVLRHLGWDHVDALVPPAGAIRIARDAGDAVTARIPHDVHLHARTLRSLMEEGDGDDDDYEGVGREEVEKGLERRRRRTTRERIAQALHEDEVVRAAELDAPAFSIVRGMTFLLVALPSLAHLAKVDAAGARLNFGPLGLLDEGPWGEGFVSRYYYVVTGGEGDEKGAREEVEVRARMVELAFEDPATGSAASALGCYLSLKRDGGGDHDDGKGVEEVRYRVTQGVEIGRKSDIELDVVSSAGGEGGARKIEEVRLGGAATVIMTGDIRV